MSLPAILITGAAGFIGYHLAERLHASGKKVICLDNFNTYYSPAFKRLRAQKLILKGVSVIEGDITTPHLLQNLIAEHKLSHLIHLAAQAGVRYSIDHPQAYIDANITGFLNVLEACKLRQELKLIYASSSSVYGTNSKIPFAIADRTDQQASLYGVTKKCNELMAATYHHLYKIPMTGLRFFTVYGPWGRPDMAYFSFCQAILEDREIDLYNYGKMQRDFTYIEDIVNGIISAIHYEHTGHKLFNLGNHRSEPIMHLIELLEKNLGKKARINFLPMQLGDVETTYADIDSSQKELCFYPKTTLEEGISKFVEWYKSITL